MLNQPVFVTIRNLSRKGRNLSWLPKSQKWVEGGETIEVPYEPWSCATDKQKEEILAELESRSITLTLNVVNTSGSYDSVPYDPSKLRRSRNSVTQSAAGAGMPKTAGSGAAADKKPAPATVSDHVVIAGSTNVEGLGLGLKASIPKPRESAMLDRAPTNALGFGISAPVDAEHSVIAGQIPKKAAETDETEEEYNRLTAAKKWAEALAVLKNRFGDKVTCGIRAVMANKEYKAIVEKFSLL